MAPRSLSNVIDIITPVSQSVATAFTTAVASSERIACLSFISNAFPETNFPVHASVLSVDVGAEVINCIQEQKRVGWLVGPSSGHLDLQEMIDSQTNSH